LPKTKPVKPISQVNTENEDILSLSYYYHANEPNQSNLFLR
jgi:hypothetical protein